MEALSRFYRMKAIDHDEETREPTAWELSVQVGVKDKLWMLEDAYIERLEAYINNGKRNSYFYRLDIPYVKSTRNMIFQSREGVIGFLNRFCLSHVPAGQ